MTDETTPNETPAASPAPAKAQKAVNRGGLILLVVIMALLAWYLLAGRYTPATTQARVQSYVVGVAPKVAGLVTEVLVANNMVVAEDQVLFHIDTSQYEIALAKAQSDLQNAMNQFEAGGAAVEASRSNLTAAKANQVKAEKDLSRLTRLRELDPGTVSVRRVEVSQATLDQAKAAVQAAEADIQRAIEQMGGQNDADNANLKAALSAVDKAELDLANTVVRAATAGVITDLQADVGRYATAGGPVMTLISMNDVWITAEFTENNLGYMDLGDPVEILFDGRPGRVYQGTVRSIGLGVGWGQSNQPGTLPTIENDRDWLRQAQRFPVIVQFDPQQNPDLEGILRVGGQATVIAYNGGGLLLKMLGKVYIRALSLLSYAY